MHINICKLLVVLLFIFETRGENCKSEKRCRISRIHGMKSADCYKKEIRDFPQCIPNDIEIIDLSYNRIRKIGKNDLKKYSNLRMLYLSDNFLSIIEKDAFEDKSELHTLDLGMNSISKLPPIIFQLPSLKSLYLGQNLNMNIVELVENAKPITSPLIKLDISYIMTEESEQFGELPDLGIMPYLIQYNISGNKLFTLSTKHFAGLCSLHFLDTSNITTEFSNPCDCWSLNRWLSHRQIKYTPFECQITENKCLDNINEDDLLIYSQCKEKVEELKRKSNLLKIGVPIIILVIIIICCIIYYLMRRRKQKLLSKKNEDKNLQLQNNRLLL